MRKNSRHITSSYRRFRMSSACKRRLSSWFAWEEDTHGRFQLMCFNGRMMSKKRVMKGNLLVNIAESLRQNAGVHISRDELKMKHKADLKKSHIGYIPSVSQIYLRTKMRDFSSRLRRLLFFLRAMYFQRKSSTESQILIWDTVRDMLLISMNPKRLRKNICKEIVDYQGNESSLMAENHGSWHNQILLYLMLCSRCCRKTIWEFITTNLTRRCFLHFIELYLQRLSMLVVLRATKSDAYCNRGCWYKTQTPKFTLMELYRAYRFSTRYDEPYWEYVQTPGWDCMWYNWITYNGTEDWTWCHHQKIIKEHATEIYSDFMLNTWIQPASSFAKERNWVRGAAFILWLTHPIFSRAMLCENESSLWHLLWPSSWTFHLLRS